MIARLIESRFVRFLIVGVSNAVVSFVAFHACFAILQAISWRGMLSQAVGYSIGILWSYFWNRRWTFRSYQSVVGESTRFIVAQVFFLATSAGLIGLAVDLFGQNPTLSWIIVMTFITLVNFATMRNWVFSGRLAD